MFERLRARGLARAEARRERRVELLAQRAAEDMPPGVRVAAEAEGVALYGRGLWRRWLGDARLRGVGLLMKGE